MSIIPRSYTPEKRQQILSDLMTYPKDLLQIPGLLLALVRSELRLLPRIARSSLLRKRKMPLFQSEWLPPKLAYSANSAMIHQAMGCRILPHQQLRRSTD
jgi:hypothetical protein